MNSKFRSNSVMMSQSGSAVSPDINLKFSLTPFSKFSRTPHFEYLYKKEKIVEFYLIFLINFYYFSLKIEKYNI